MPVATSFPGVYIQEIPSNTHTIAAAPTSVTVFVGYVHPFKTPTANFGQALEIFSFSDYERLYGGFYQSGVIDANVSYAVNEFFTNGGTDAYVVGLQPKNYFDNTGNVKGAIVPATATLNAAAGVGITFTALEPTDSIPIVVSINNVQKDSSNKKTIADLNITYGTQTEVFRKISIDKTSPNFIDSSVQGVSLLVSVGPAVLYPAAFTVESKPLKIALAANQTNVFNAADFLGVFQQDSALDKVQVFNLLLTPGIINNAVLSEALAFCERKMAFFIMDPPAVDVADGGPGTNNWVGDFLNGTGDTSKNIAPQSPNGALYFPYLLASNPVTGQPFFDVAKTIPFTLPPSGYVAGIFAATDASRGVWKAPAGLATTLLDCLGVVPGGVMTDSKQGVLNNIGVNCIRSFPGSGTVVFGSRTLVSANPAFQQWKYVPVRRMALFIEQTLKTNLTWVIFEPNDDPLWVAIRVSIESFMLSLFNQGAFAGITPSVAFQVKCDSTTTTPDDQANGIVNIIVAFAPLRPAEFVIVKIAQLAGQAQS